MSELGSLLRKLRGEQSLRDMSRKSGTSHTYLSIIERGVDPRSGHAVKPTPEILKILSKAYNYPYEELMRISGYLSESQEHYKVDDVPQLTSEHKVELEQILLRADVAFKGKGLDEADRKRVLDMLSLLFHNTVEEEKKEL